METTRLMIPSARRSKIPFKYCVRDLDRHGNERIYLRLPNRPKYRMKAPLYDEQGSVTREFVEEYHKALTEDRAQAAPKMRTTLESGSIAWLIHQYYQSSEFLAYSPATQKDKQSVLNRYMDAVGHLPYNKLRRSNVEASQAKRAKTPGAADKLLKYLKRLFNWAMDKNLATFNPVGGISKLNKSRGFHTWSQRELAQYRDAYPLGTMARLAFELMLSFGVRRSDLVKLGPANLFNGRLEFIPQKGDGATTLSLPITSELTEALDACAPHQKTFLVTEAGAPFTSNGFGNRMRKWCDDIGLKDRSAHGLRKSSATALAEAGASEKQLMAVFGWKDPKMARLYTEAAESRSMTDGAFQRLEAHRKVPLSPAAFVGGTKGEENAYFSMPIGKGGRPGGTRTPNQTVMSGRL